jgi:cytoskeletal protein CcmA (bactofilin family)
LTCGRVHIGRKGIVEGTINAGEVVIEGEVRGQVVSGSSLVVGSTGRCYGEVVARALRIDHGAVLMGPVRVNEALLNQVGTR